MDWGIGLATLIGNGNGRVKDRNMPKIEVTRSTVQSANRAAAFRLNGILNVRGL